MSIQHSSTTSSHAASRLDRQGLALPAKPSYEIPALPTDLTDLGDEDLMLLYTKLTAYADFIGVQVSVAQVDERSLEKQLSTLENTLMLSSTGKSENRVTFARAQVASNDNVKSLKAELESVYAYRKLIEALAANVERDAALVSRELTRRTSSKPRNTRWSS